jgi:peptide/nickel transport system substrate-binding protein
MLLLGLSLGIIGAVPTAASAAKPQRGGTITIPATWVSLDPTSSTFTTGAAEIGYQALGGLFTEFSPTGSTKILQPELATGYTYSNSFRTLTVTLRKGVEFQDGTPFNATAAIWNINAYRSATNLTAELLTGVTSVTAKGQYTIVLTSSQPNSNLVDAFVDEDFFFMSPTAYASEGSNFAINPIGAGPFKVTSNNPSVSLTMTAWNGYWNQKHRYLSQINVLQAPETAGDEVMYADLQSGSLNWYYDPTDSPSILKQGYSNSSVKHLLGPSLGYTFLAVNTYKPPFNNQLAREALDYCTNRTSITSNIFLNTAVPSYWLGGSGIDFYPGTPKGKKFPYYNYDPAQGQALVKQLGGLSFQFQVGTAAAQQLVPSALAAEWQQDCGINATLAPTQAAAETQDHATGNFQLYLQTFGGYTDPDISVGLFSLPTSSFNKWGFNSPTVTNLINASGYTDNTLALDKLWARIWLLEDKLAVNIPLYSGPTVYFYTKNLHGALFSANLGDFSSAWLS